MFRKTLAVALAAAAVLTVILTGADSRPHHRHKHWARRHHHYHHVHYVRRHARRHHYRFAQLPPARARDYGDVLSGFFRGAAGAVSHTMESVISVGEKTVGAGASQLGLRRTLWCAAWVNKMLARVGLRGTGSDAAISFARWGRPSAPKRGAIMVMPHHVGVVTGSCGRGSVRLLSGNHGHRVAESCYSIRRAVAFRSA